MLRRSSTMAVMGLLVFGCRVEKHNDFKPVASASAPAPSASVAWKIPEDAGAQPIDLEATPPPEGSEALAFAGLGTDDESAETLRTAIETSLLALGQGERPELAAARGTVILEDDPKLNAGSGSALRADGKTIELDAALMDSTGRFAAVGACTATKNPILVAHRLLDAPNPVLVGQGADRFARISLPMDTEPPVITPVMRGRWTQARDRLKASDAGVQPWAAYLDAGAPAPPPSAAPSASAPPASSAPDSESGPPPPPSASATQTDSVAILLRADQGRFVAAISSGGTEMALPGRLGDVPVRGAGIFVGKRGAVAVTGKGETLLAERLARRVYDRLDKTRSAKLAVQWGLKQIEDDEPVGIAVLGLRTRYAKSRGKMAWVGWRDGDWSGAKLAAKEPQPGAPDAVLKPEAATETATKPGSKPGAAPPREAPSAAVPPKPAPSASGGAP